MTDQSDDITTLGTQAKQALERVETAQELEQWRIAYIGRKGAVPRLLRGVKDLPENERKSIGQAANALRQELEDAFEQKRQTVGPATSEQVEAGDATTELPPGHFHPITLSTRRIQQILADMGFLIVEGPEVEQEYYDFDALNVPLEHPARAESDSFYVHPRKQKGDGLVLRTQTSSVQVRAVVEYNLAPPFKVASPGRVFRNEKPDATHEATFHQIEVLAVGEDITIAEYKGTTEKLFSEFFGRQAKTRLRPGYFPFVEPGFEVDMSCVFCEQKGCRVCSHTGWLEMGGAGMVHPNVLKNMNIDPNKFQGFAWGYGIDRFTMLQHGINDIRLFWSGDIRFLKQFS